GGGDGAGLGPADVGDVGEGAVQLLLVLVEQRQLPATVVGLASGVQQLRYQRVVIAHDAGGVGTQGDHAGAGEGGDVDHAGGVEALGVGQGVAQYQTAFGIGVEDLDGLTGHAGDDVTGLGSGAAGHGLQ